jgi:hypothetical protein
MHYIQPKPLTEQLACLVINVYQDEYFTFYDRTTK